MNPSRHERDLLNGYLLGYLTEEEREQVAVRLFADDAFAEALEDAERDLLDDYAQRKLSAPDRAAVTSRLLNSESQREKLRFAEAWARGKTRSVFPMPRILLCAAAVLVTLSASWMWLRTAPAPSKTAEAPAVHQPAQPLTPEPAPVFAALLAPGSVRGDADMPEVVLPPQAKFVRFDLQLEGASDAPSYSIKLLHQREKILEQSGLTRHLEGGAPVLSVVVNSKNLSTGLYRITVTAAPPSDPHSYYFRIR